MEKARMNGRTAPMSTEDLRRREQPQWSVRLEVGVRKVALAARTGAMTEDGWVDVTAAVAAGAVKALVPIMGRQTRPRNRSSPAR
eukprot:7388901-Prymnesium_polylepis.2